MDLNYRVPPAGPQEPEGAISGFRETCLFGVRLVRFDQHTDARGTFRRTWCLEEFSNAGLMFHPVQANSSTTWSLGTVRGMHFQRKPHAEAKLVRCTAGRVWDVVVDLRPDSPTFRDSFAFEMSALRGDSILLPAGVAHGFQTLTDDVVMEYLMSEPYDASAADGFRYDDPEVAIAWPMPVKLVSHRDLAWMALKTRPFWTSACDDGLMT